MLLANVRIYDKGTVLLFPIGIYWKSQLKENKKTRLNKTFTTGSIQMNMKIMEKGEEGGGPEISTNEIGYLSCYDSFIA